MATRLFVSSDRAAAHAFLEQITATVPTAECREDSGIGEYAVYDGPEPWVDRPVAPGEVARPVLLISDEQLGKLADSLAPLVADRLKSL